MGMGSSVRGGLRVSWCRDPKIAAEAAGLMISEAGPDYISHGELQGGRAIAPGEWAPDLADRVTAAFTAAAARDLNASGQHLATVVLDDRLVGFAAVSFASETLRPYAVLEDMIVAGAVRGKGVGAAVLGWLAGECRARNLDRIFLESGIANTAAHAFFERHGFETVSIVKMRALASARP